MIIHPCKHKVKIKSHVPIGDIPLAYLYGNERKRDVSIEIEEDFIQPSHKEIVQLYQTFETQAPLLFDDDEKIVSDVASYFKKNPGTGYSLQPRGLISESAIHNSEEFSYRVLVQRADTYKKSVTYNIKAAAGNKDIADRLISLLNQQVKNLYPANIMFNDGALTSGALLNHNLENIDVLFTTLDDFQTNILGNSDIPVSTFADFLDMYHTNLWLFDNNFDDTYQLGIIDNTQYAIKNPQIYGLVSGTTDFKSSGLYFYFDSSKKWDELPESDFIYHDIYSIGEPIRIVERPHGGFIILSHPDILKNLSKYASLIMENIMYVYLNGYYITGERTSFVTDDAIDYYITINKKYGLCHPQINLTKILLEERFNNDITYRIVDVIINKNAKYIGVNRYNELQFKKISERLQEHNKSNNILAYSSKKTLMLYKPIDEHLWTIESGAEIYANDDKNIVIEPVLSTKYQIATYETQIISIPYGVGVWFLCYNRETSRFELLTSQKMSETDCVLIATIRLKDNKDISYKDIRTTGGGEWSTIPNYEMIDSGNILGRPIRYGSIMVIQLPQRFSPMAEEIRTEVVKHITSGDYPVFLFKD